MSFQLSASGSIQHSTVDKLTVDGLVHATDNFMLYLGLANFSGGIVVTAALTLAAGVKHPTPIYLALAAGLSLTVAMLIALLREIPRVRELRAAIQSSTAGINWTITPTTGGPTIVGTPLTSTGGSPAPTQPATRSSGDAETDE